MQPRDSVIIRVPGSTSNCGAGFDTLGLALAIYNRVSLKRVVGFDVLGERPRDRRGEKMAGTAARAFFAHTGRKPLGFSFRVDGEVPPARGLGSSVTVLAGVVAGLDALEGTGLSRHDMVSIVTAIEGHPDNASAGILGGFCVARCRADDGRYVDSIRFEIPDELAFVVASPAVEVVTKESRGALPASLPYFDAVKSINSASYLVAAFASRDYAKLRDAVHDTMHEPYRLPRIPGGRAAIEAGVAAGALTGWLSGSGSSVLCVTHRALGERVAEAMREAFAAVKIPCEARILFADNQGLVLEGV
ncbi:MAG TPA: homoserine kinase [Opitutaceae bacterium]